jgi:hypothetical protein
MSSTTSSPLGATRRLGTQSGAMRREARRITRAGGNADGLLQQAAVTKLNEGSAITSADSAIKEQRFQQRAQNGIAAGQRGVLNTLANQSRQGQGQTGGGQTGGGGISGGQMQLENAGSTTLGSTTPGPGMAPGTGVAPGTGPTGGAKPMLPPVGIGVTKDEGAEKRIKTQKGILSDIAKRTAGGGLSQEGALSQINSERASKGMAPVSIDVNEDKRRADTEDSIFNEVVKRTTGDGVGLSRKDALDKINSERRERGEAPISIDFAARSQEASDKRTKESSKKRGEEFLAKYDQDALKEKRERIRSDYEKELKRQEFRDTPRLQKEANDELDRQEITGEAAAKREATRKKEIKDKEDSILAKERKEMDYKAARPARDAMRNKFLSGPWMSY